MTVTIERAVLATDGNASVATAATRVLFLARILDVLFQAVSATGTSQSFATETIETETAGASVGAFFEAEETVGTATRRVLLAGVRLTSEVVDGPAAIAVVLGVDGNDEARLAGCRAAGTVASRVVRHTEVLTLVVPPNVGDGDISGPRGRR